ncbi:chemosensory pili system protein ChpA (sensor histidine kinase/response regulator) [Dyella jiangningensis]|uniref:Hpt domain-containing protein n=2 Tax=Gammaproteobacteria TaxID=1236 RepID=UPI0008889F61|nr:Hpt domain-containing protein [Dyella sp. AtDHG13]PXV58160.1 chemosensory pili system protein ChpA (sensor histidine kinase/response regulator) [Dyella sp. AtDHG13]SDK13540.1 chemosensory pili system protein ChpA (sensor histidine kinase/response regulator) [Dyella jiangningensis]
MRLQDHIDFTTLQWVKPELDETLALAREALESYVDNPGDRAAMRSCADSLHQVHGTLRMVELYGAAMVTEEMETLAISLLEDHVANREEAYAALMRGLMQLPDYLERLSGGHRDVPVVLLPLLNDLRSSRGQQALHESALFTPNLEVALPAQAPAPLQEVNGERQRSEVTTLRLRFQQQLLSWFRGQGGDQQLAGMIQTLDAITARCHTVPGRRLWWIAAGVLEGVQQGALKSQTGEVRQLIGKVDRSIRQLVEHGEASLRGGDADELARKLLYVVGQVRQGSPRMEQLRQTYALDALLPEQSEVEHARGSMAGHNRALLDSVAKALKDDLLRVKESLDLFLRQTDADPAQLASQTEILERVGDTLGMLALGVPRRVVNEQRRVLDEIVSRVRAPDEELLLDVAGALLYVEASLDDHIESLGADGEPASETPTSMLPRSEARHILATLMHEATANTGKVKDAIVAYVESGWQSQQLAEVGALMDEVSGALRMLSAPRPAELAEGIGRFVGNELLTDRRVPSTAQMDHLADALAALEYYLEAAREHRGGLEHILDVAEHSLSSLGYWPPPAARGPSEDELDATPPEHVARAADAALAAALANQPDLSESVSVAHGEDLTGLIVGRSDTPQPEPQEITGLRLADTVHITPQEPVQGADEGDWIEIEEEVVEEVPVSGAAAVDAGFQTSTAGIDDDIRDIFLEEMQEEIDSLHASRKTWLADAQQLDALTPIRRSFHTLKGSGRLVGATLLGEFAWKVENMLNRVLDHSVPPNEGVQEVVSAAIDALPPLRAALMGEGAVTVPVTAIMEIAERLASGQVDARLADVPATGATETVRRIVRRRVPRVSVAAEAIPAATLAEIETTPAEAEAPTPAHDVIDAPVMPPIDPVLLEILRSEVAQYLATIRTAINRVDGELRVEDSLLRAVHTLHGAIAMVDIPLLTQLLSPLESLLKRLRAAGQPLSPEGVLLLSQSADAVDHVMNQFDAPSPQLPDLDSLIHRLTELRDSQPEPKVAHVLFETPVDTPDEAPLHAAAPTHEESLAASLDEALSDASLPVEHIELAAPAAPEAAGGDYADELLAALGEYDLDAHLPAADQLPHATQPEHVASGAEDDELAKAYADLIGEAETLEIGPVAHEAEVPVEHAGTPEAEVEDVAIAPEADAIAHHFIEETEMPDVAEATDGEHAASIEALPPIDELPIEEIELEAPTVHVSDEAIETEAPVVQVPVEEAEPETQEVYALAEEVAPEAPLHAESPELAETAAHVDAHDEAALLPHQIDPDLLEIFIEEAREILDHSDSVLAQWRAEPAAVEHLAEIQRDLHTLKGGARIAGMVPVGDLTHAIETALEKPLHAESAHIGELIAALEVGFDKLHGLVQLVSQGKPVPYPQAIIDRFLAMAGEESATETAAAAPLAQEPANVVPFPARTAPLPELLPEERGDEVQSTPQEQIRVRAELLDSLVNHAGEVAIYRSRLEQQVAGYRFNLVELDQTVQRLRGQLRMMEIETEAQIIARFQREHREAGISVFDPLELDRFSQLQQYSRALAESVSDLVSIQGMLDELTRQAETLLIQQSRVSSELQEGLLRTRMLPFDTMVPNLRRTLRQAAQEEGKGAQLYVEGAHGEMDRNLLDRIKAPFEHMLRNAVAHGIESPAERRKAGKPEEGAVRIRVAREATEVVVRVTDDGRGLDRDAIRKRGVERGLVRADARLSDDQVLALITQPGFSTASTVTQLAGRGVGMDVVANEIKQLGGALSIESKEGQGTTFVLRLPFTLAVTQAILVRIGESTFAIPMTSVQGVARITPAELAERMADPEPTFPYGGESYDIHELSSLLGISASHAGDEEQIPLLLTRSGDLRAAIRIDAVIGSREIVVKSVGPQISSVPGILGATIMGDGSVLIILDLAPLVRHGIARRQARLEEGLSAVATPVVEEPRVRPLVMVVDDSITMRKVTGRVLERHEYEVATAKDGVDALEKLHERVPDLMLLDIEMPRMDGYELATHMKADPRLRDVPIIMITSRTGDKHRQRAFDIGVDRYLGKPYQEAELLAQIGEVLEQRTTESLNG